MVETFQYGFGYGTTDLRFCSAAEFIDQDEAAFIAVLHHYLHIGKMRRIGTQIIFNGLLVTYINEYAAENTRMAAFMHGNEHTTLQHIL